MNNKLGWIAPIFCHESIFSSFAVRVALQKAQSTTRQETTSSRPSSKLRSEKHEDRALTLTTTYPQPWRFRTSYSSSSTVEYKTVVVQRAPLSAVPFFVVMLKHIQYTVSIYIRALYTVVSWLLSIWTDSTDLDVTYAVRLRRPPSMEPTPKSQKGMLNRLGTSTAMLS